MGVVDESTTDPGLPDLNGVDVGGSDVGQVGVNDGKVGVQASPERSRPVAYAVDSRTTRGVAGKCAREADPLLREERLLAFATC